MFRSRCFIMSQTSRDIYSNLHLIGIFTFNFSDYQMSYFEFQFYFYKIAVNKNDCL